jgi:hypothetical protein
MQVLSANLSDRRSSGSSSSNNMRLQTRLESLLNGTGLKCVTDTTDTELRYSPFRAACTALCVVNVVHSIALLGTVPVPVLCTLKSL